MNIRKINLNKMAKWIAEKEGKKMELNIAQIKEVLKLTLIYLRKQSFGAVAELLKRKRD